MVTQELSLTSARSRKSRRRGHQTRRGRGCHSINPPLRRPRTRAARLCRPTTRNGQSGRTRVLRDTITGEVDVRAGAHDESTLATANSPSWEPQAPTFSSFTPPGPKKSPVPNHVDCGGANKLFAANPRRHGPATKPFEQQRPYHAFNSWKAFPRSVRLYLPPTMED